MSRLLTVLVVVLFAGCASSGSGKHASNAHDSDLSSSFKSSDSDSTDSDSANSESDSDAKSNAKSGDDSVDADDVSYAKKQQLPPGPACLDQSGSVQECMSDTDCCKNFYCGIDPTGSPRQKVCLYGGK